MNKIMTFGGLGVAAILGLSLIFGSWYTVDQGEGAVLLTNGAVSSIEGPGFHFKLPFFQSVQNVSTQSHFECFASNWDSQGNEIVASGCGSARLDTYSNDQQDLKVTASIGYRVPTGSEGDVYARYGSVDALVYRVIDQRFPSISKEIFGQYTIQDAIQKRAKLNADILSAMQDSVKGLPIMIESVQITDVKATKEYEDSIEAKQQATVQVQQQEELLDQEKIKAQIALTTATGQANSQVAAATAKAIELKGEADAAAIEARGKALRDNPNVIPLILAQEWDGKLPVTMAPGSTVPFINVTPSATAQ